MKKNEFNTTPLIIGIIYTLIRGVVLYYSINWLVAIGQGCPTCIGLLFFIPLALIIGYLSLQISMVSILAVGVLSQIKTSQKILVGIHVFVQLLFEVLLVGTLLVALISVISGHYTVLEALFQLFNYTNQIIIGSTVISTGILGFLLFVNRNNVKK